MRQATPIVLDESQRQQLEGLKHGRRVSVRLAERAAIVLHAADGLENQQIGEVMGISRQKAGRWRDRYAAREVLAPYASAYRKHGWTYAVGTSGTPKRERYAWAACCMRLVKSLTPGPYTFIVKGTKDVPRMMLQPRKLTVGVRVPDHRVALALHGEHQVSNALAVAGAALALGAAKRALTPDEIAQELVVLYQRRLAAGIGGAEEGRLDAIEIALLVHPLHQHLNR